MDEFEKELKTGFLEEAAQLLADAEQSFLSLEAILNLQQASSSARKLVIITSFFSMISACDPIPGTLQGPVIPSQWIRSVLWGNCLT